MLALRKGTCTRTFHLPGLRSEDSSASYPRVPSLHLPLSAWPHAQDPRAPRQSPHAQKQTLHLTRQREQQVQGL